MRDVYLARVIPAFVMYCVNGASCSSILIESTDSISPYLHTSILPYYLWLYYHLTSLYLSIHSSILQHSYTSSYIHSPIQPYLHTSIPPNMSILLSARTTYMYLLTLFVHTFDHYNTAILPHTYNNTAILYMYLHPCHTSSYMYLHP